MSNVGEEIKALVRGLFEDKQAYKELETSIDKDSGTLKTWMSSRKADEMTVDDIKVTYKPQVRSAMDEGKTIAIIKALAEQAETDELRTRLMSCVHTKEYVDETELESLIYDDVVPKEALEPAMLTKTIFVLKLAKSRKKD